MLIWKCKKCGCKIFSNDVEGFDKDLELEDHVWGHVQFVHPEIFEEIQDCDTAYLLDSMYERFYRDYIVYRGEII